MSEFLIRPADVFEIIKRQKLTIALSFVTTFIVVMAIYVVIPRSYRSEAVIHIGVSYFQNPLIGDLISQTHDPGELRSERERIIKTSLGVDFANAMGEKYHIFKTRPDDSGRAVEVENFLKALDIAPVTATQFSIKYKGKSAETTDGIIHSAIDAVREYMYAHRVQMLEEFFGVLQDEIAGTGGGAAGSPENSGAKLNAERSQISAQIQVLEKRLEDLQRAYNERHPSVQAVKAELQELRSAEKSGALSPRLTRRRIFRNGPSGSGQSTIKDDLSKQGHLVNISLEMEKKDPTMSAYISLVKEPVYPKNPVFPKLRLFLLFALVASVMASTIGAALAEFWARTDVLPKNVAEKLSIETLGLLVIPESLK